MEEIEITWPHAIKIWWALVWRMSVFGFLIGGAAGLIVGIVFAAQGVVEYTKIYGQLIGAILGIPIGIWVVKIILTMQFRDFRIALVPSTEILLEKSVNESSAPEQ